MAPFYTFCGLNYIDIIQDTLERPLQYADPKLTGFSRETFQFWVHILYFHTVTILNRKCYGNGEIVLNLIFVLQHK